MDWLFPIWLPLGLGALVVSLLVTLQTFEFRRYCRKFRARRSTGDVHTLPRISVFVPVKGCDDDLSTNFNTLFNQDVANYEIVFIVESRQDPAYPILRALVDSNPARRPRIVVAGIATDCGQKVHNLRVATERLPADTEIVAFLDSDSRPRPDWLRMLTRNIGTHATTATTSYRQFVPAKNNLASLVLCSLNAAIFPLIGKSRWPTVWGGSWAIRRDAFERVGIRDAWRGKLVDDLQASEVLARHKVATFFEPDAVIESPLAEITWPRLWEFACRQYRLGRFYTPVRWRVSVLAVTVLSLAYSLGAIGLIFGLRTEHRWWFAAVTFALFGLQALRTHWRWSAIASDVVAEPYRLHASRWFDTLCGPFTMLVCGVTLLASACSSKITWRGISYQMFAGGSMRRIDRPSEPERNILAFPFEARLTSKPPAPQHEMPAQRRAA